MFRSLATRLTATYVFAAIVLTFAVAAAVIALALSSFGIGERGLIDAVARRVPYESKLAVARAGSMRAAAPTIVANLVQPGVRVEIAYFDGKHHQTVVAITGPDNRPVLTHRHWRGAFLRTAPPPGGVPALSLGGPPPGGGFSNEAGAGAPPGGAPPDGPVGPEPGGPGPAGGLHGDRSFAYSMVLVSMLHVDPRRVDIPDASLFIVPDAAPLERTIHDFLVALAPIGALAIFLAWLLGRFITNQALRPLVETTASLNRFGAGDFTPRAIATTDRNEIGELVKAYNAAAAQVTAAFEERRLAEQHMRQFIADAGHELRTPLTVIMGFIDVLRRRATNDGALARPGETTISTKIFDTMLAESRRMKSLIEKLILLARLENVLERERETVDLGAVAAQVVAALQALETRPRIALRADADAYVRGYESELHDALSNLVENALKYAPESPIGVRVSVEGDEVVAEVTDRGPGIAAEEQTQVFSRFYRGRDHGDAEGFGLGLAIAARAVERSNGTITLVSAPGQGAAFTIRIPRATRGEAVALAV